MLLLSSVLGLISMFAYGFASAFSKPLANKFDPIQVIYLRGLIICLILAILSIPHYQDLAHIKYIFLALGLGIVGYLPSLAFMYSIKNSPLGIVAPIAGASPFITVLLSFIFLNIPIKSLQWLAIFLIIIANMVVAINIRDWRRSNIFKLSSGVPFALMATIGWGLFYFLLVPITKHIDPWLSALFVEVGVTLMASLHIQLTNRKLSIKDIKKNPIILNGILICLGTLGFTIGVQYFNVGIVETLSNSTALITIVLSIYLFHEHLHLKERLSSLIMILGIIILSIF